MHTPSKQDTLIFPFLLKQFRFHRLTWHNGVIPPDVVWLKLGGMAQTGW